MKEINVLRNYPSALRASGWSVLPRMCPAWLMTWAV